MTVHQFEAGAAGAQGYAINWDTAETRVKELKAYLMNAPQVMDPERLQFLNEVYEEFQGEPVFYIRAKLLERVLLKKKIFLDGNPIVGTLTGTRAGVYAYPEWNVSWIKEEMQMAKMASLGEMKIPQETTELLEKTYKKWKGRTCIDLNNKMFKDKYGFNPAPYSKAGIYYDNVSVASGSGIADYPLALNKGLRWVIDDIKQRLLDCSTTLANKEKHDLYRAMIVATEAVIAHSHRYADLAEKTAETETDPKARAELLEIAEICRRVPEFPARNFREAMQCQWFVQMFSRIEQKASAIISNGRMDQYLYPFYKKDIEEGTLTPAQAKELLECMWVDMAQFIDLYINPTGVEFQEGYAHWEAVTIGGQTPDGEDATNELTYLFLESKREFPLNYPDLAARIHSRSPERFLREVALTIKDGSGFPKLINDEEVVFLNTVKGCPVNEALDYAVSGCTETRMPNRDTYTSGCVYVNFATALEMLLYNGRMLHYGDELIGLETGDATKFKTWEEFYDAYKAQHLNLLRKAFQQQHIVDKLRPQHFAAPLSSVLHNLCMEHCLDLHTEKIPGGVDYSYFEFLGYGTVVDSLAAIKKLVFEDKKLTMQEVLDACKADFKGYEPVREMLRNAPCYGNNDPYVDSIAKDIDRFTQVEAEKSTRERGVHVDVRYVPITSHVPFGKVVSATPNGRHAWTALSDGSSASHGADKNGPTAVLLSNYHSKNYGMINRASRLLNIKLSPKCVAGDEGTEKIVSLIRTWCDLKLWHLQFNIVNKQTLLNAQKEPDNYRSLLVRIAGYSAYFCDLSRDLQNDIIDRTEHSQF